LAIITVNVGCNIGVKYGYSFTVGRNGEACAIKFTPFAGPFIQASGGASIWKLAEGGVYASGYVANAYFNFEFGVNIFALSAYYNINVEFRPF
jgi:uncharacterized protein (DUF697 family)